MSGPKCSMIKRLAGSNGLPEQILKFLAMFAPDVDMIVRPHEAWLEFAIRSHAETVAEGTELGVVDRPDHFNLCTVKTVFFPVMHPPSHDLF